MTNVIPPEGDEYNARRQEELHAAVANKAQLTRRMLEMVRDDAPAEQIGAVIDAIASIDREIPHISKDLAVSVQGRNLTIFLDRMDTSLEQNTGRVLASVQISLDTMLESVGQVLRRIVKVEKDVTVLKKGQTASDKQIATVMQQLGQLGQLAEKTNYLAEEHNRIATEQLRLTEVANELARDVADLKAWRLALESKGGGHASAE